MNPEELFEVIRTRRSVRVFGRGEVSGDDLGRILEAARWAPSGTNTQNWRFIAVRSPEVKTRMRTAVDDRLSSLASRIEDDCARGEFESYGRFYRFFASASVVVAVVVKPYESLAARLAARFGLADLAGAPTTADVQGPSAAVQNMLLMAHCLGYGACWMTGPLIARAELERILGIRPPDGLLALVPVGVPAERSRQGARRPYEETVTLL